MKGLNRKRKALRRKVSVHGGPGAPRAEGTLVKELKGEGALQLRSRKGEVCGKAC